MINKKHSNIYCSLLIMRSNSTYLLIRHYDNNSKFEKAILYKPPKVLLFS